MTTDAQLELGLKAKALRPSAQRRATRVARARWWFAQMREAVENAIDWQTESTPHAEQIWIPGTKRSVKA